MKIKKEEINKLWNNVDKLEEQISELKERGKGYSVEWKKRSRLVKKIVKLETS